MDLLDELTAYYPTAPWVALLRAFEVEQTHAVRALCAQPVLDLGCGDGFVGSLAMGSSMDVGVDIDRASLQKAADRGVYRLVINADARHLPLAKGTFRTVYCNGAMEHMNDLDAVLGEIVRVMLPGGVLVTLVPSDRFREPIGWLGRLLGRGVWDAYNRLHNHVNLLSPEQWRHRLEARGMVVRDIQTYGATAAAEFISNRDLWSKVHLAPRWPLLHLRHGGNLGRIMLRPTTAFLRRLFTHREDAVSIGYWLMIVAERRV